VLPQPIDAEGRNTYLQADCCSTPRSRKSPSWTRKRPARSAAGIEELQASRSQMVHLFDELARTIPTARRSFAGQNGNDLTCSVRAVQRPGSYMPASMPGWMSNLT
jgi:type IV pilus assembly protein PilN